MIAAGTIGTSPPGVAYPRPRSSSQRIAPSAAASPKALPPLSTTPLISAAPASGPITSVSRVPGPPPRTSTPALLPGGTTTAVQPVSPSRFVQCPI